MRKPLNIDAFQALAAEVGAAAKNGSPEEDLAERVDEAVTELRARRAADLSAEEVEALEFARKVVSASESLFADRMGDPKVAAHVERCMASKVLLDRLIAGGAK